MDLVNTEVIKRGVRHDLLKSTDDLKLWIKTMTCAKALDPMQLSLEVDEEWTTNDLEKIRSFRAVLRTNFEHIAAGNSPDEDWIEELEERIRNTPFSYKLVADQLLPFPLGTPGDSLLSLVAFDALQLLSGEKFRHIRRCENPDCVLLFWDSTGRRKWCSMKICGNRTKVARFQSRRKSEMHT